MGSVIDRINENLYCLTPSEAKAAEYCKRHPDAVVRGSINEVAKGAGVSIASVSRLAATLGYRDWKDVRLSLARDSSDGDNPIYPEIDIHDPDAAVVKKVFEGNVVSLRNTLARLDMEAVARVVDALARTDRVVFFGSGGSGCMAMDEALRFSHLDFAAECYTDDYLMMIQAAQMKPGQIAFGFSYSGRSRASVAALVEARHCGAMTVGVANHRHTPLKEASDVFFYTIFPRSGGIATLTARLALLSLMDSLYVLAAQHGRMGPKADRVNRVIEKNLRFSARRG
ncbi:MAG: MurR/RpiR family transcriptional regulator [Planctomycetota bacterium]|nr:MurR/RpiR family transcriptional regulator [Planctomycetota bacterium]